MIFIKVAQNVIYVMVVIVTKLKIFLIVPFSLNQTKVNVAVVDPYENIPWYTNQIKSNQFFISK